MKKLNIHFLFTVLDDLEFLDKNWGNDITESQIRRNSPVLRYLLVDGKIKEAGAMLNQRIRVLTPLSSLEENLPEKESIKFFMSGGASTNKGRIGRMVVYDRALSAEEVKNMYEMDKVLSGKSKAVPIDTFLNQVSFIYGKCKIKRRTVIKYMCNKMGGTHYDSKRKIPTSISTEVEDEHYSFLDRIYTTWKSFDMNVIHLELLGIGQRFIDSTDVKNLKKGIQLLKKA